MDRALIAAVTEMHATGTSTRKVQRAAEKTGVPRLSKDQVSAIASSLDADIEELCARPLDGSPVPYVWLDATYVKCRREGRAPGVGGVGLDAHPGLVRALGEVFQGAAWQRCAVHLMRDCMREAGSWQLRLRVGRIVSQVIRGRDAATVAAMYHAACDMLEGCCPRAAAILEEVEPDALVYLDFPPTHWKCLRTNNVQERTNREIERRSRVVQVFPSTGSLVRLAGAVMCEQDEIWQESRYFSEARMNELYDEGRTRGIDGPVDWARLEAGGQEDARVRPRACGQGRDGIGYQPCSRFQDAGPPRFGSGFTPTFSTLPLL